MLYERRNEEGTVTGSVTIANALQRDTFDAIVMGDRLLAPDEKVAWHVREQDCRFDSVAFTPRKGDTITTGGVVWIVWTVQHQTFGCRFRLVCVRK